MNYCIQLNLRTGRRLPRPSEGRGKGLVMVTLAMALAPMAALAQQPLHIPSTLSGGTYNLTMGVSTTEFFPGVATTTYGYNGPLLGPTLIMEQGQLARLNVENQLGEEATTHWHGMHVPAGDDGGPHSIIDDGTTWSIDFTVMDSASTMWYHPHLHQRTTEQVDKGLAGMIFVRDAVEAAAGLPSTYGVDEFPLILQDRAFNADGSINVVPLGDTMMVNGTIEPFLAAPAQVVRLRVLNGSNERTFNLGFDDGRSYFVIGTDGGLMPAPVPVSRFFLSPGERVDILVNLAGAALGSTLNLLSFGSELPADIAGARGAGPLDGADFQILELRLIEATASAVTEIPAAITTLNKYAEADAAVTRHLPFNFAGGVFTIGDSPFDMSRIDQTVQLGDVEIWELENTTFLSHPFHIHDIQFFILDRNGVAPAPQDAGKKDTVLVRAGETVRFITKFDDFADPDIPYMYHCHILPHEDAGMMGQFVVVE